MRQHLPAKLGLMQKAGRPAILSFAPPAAAGLPRLAEAERAWRGAAEAAEAREEATAALERDLGGLRRQISALSFEQKLEAADSRAPRMVPDVCRCLVV